jgi:cupin 2 domain-containing protein
MGSLFDNIPTALPDELFETLVSLPDELFETLVSSDQVRIERIVSRGHASPEGFWYDQEENEFVLVVQGSAGLRVEGMDDILVMKPGDYMNIKAHVRHRVEWTDAACVTIWLAVFYHQPEDGG